ncbi:4-hydroxybenzoate octaprenyltransferase [Candidatus Erwinia haradaeae]|uniref:4-hydroxybenzoate octaprenyltransferase n=1 Tax=Candidatus Erwinia haradaeae TaxID=1922217 RepID=A0A451CZG8_9GAMM|nr:4-hydroxybenzoate octaprenyltransferase [Candidatus Erwinia haradaeae]VFP78548.1 4-hydroxybenzoate octaprenyltransferase [Candidatus Erwinia haradaeae]
MNFSYKVTKLVAYCSLIRGNQPVGLLLLLWPTLWALWLSEMSSPSFRVFLIFILGVFSMRSAGCIVNDLVDWKIDSCIKRTCKRPIPSGLVSKKEAKILFLFFVFLSFSLVLMMNEKTIFLSFIGLFLTLIYPFMKRYTNLPQMVLGISFSWPIPMVWAEVTQSLPKICWLLFLANIFWVMVYDTQYAMVDRSDDLKVGVRSSAILFNRYDKLIIGCLQLSVLIVLILIGWKIHLAKSFYYSIFIIFLLFIYQQMLIADRHPEDCFQAFLNNNWVGFVLFLGIFFGI